MKRKERGSVLIHTIVCLTMFSPTLFLAKEPLFPILSCLFVYFGARGFYGLHEIPESRIVGDASPLLMFSACGSMFLFSICNTAVNINISDRLSRSAVFSHHVPVVLVAAVLAVTASFFYGKLYDIQGFATAIIPALILYALGIAGFLIPTGPFSLFLSVFFVLTGELCGSSIFASILNCYMPSEHRHAYYLLRFAALVFAPLAAGIFSPFVTLFPSGHMPVFALIDLAFVFVSLTEVYVVIRQSHFTLFTEEGERLFPEIAKAFDAPDGEPVTWTEYPRPQLVRKEWKNLNGIWHLNHGTVYVPFPPQSELSCYKRTVSDSLTYERRFSLPPEWRGMRILLHFGAVDQTCDVIINGKTVGSHEGGYLPFTFDITGFVSFEGHNGLEVKVTDTLSHTYPYGKQRRPRGGMWYTPVSGIWQTVWLEPVPDSYIESLAFTPEFASIGIKIVTAHQPDTINRAHIDIMLDNGEIIHLDTEESRLSVDLSSHICADGSYYVPRCWTPDDPYLYKVKIRYTTDEVETYFALRTFSVREVNDIPRVCLNGHPIFIHGVLDQGYFPDGIYTPACAEVYRKDILRMKELGFNCLRKHAKVEPEIFYHYCDSIGMLVFQDMVNSGSYRLLRDGIMATVTENRSDVGRGGSEKRKDFFINHCIDTQRTLINHPSVFAYTIFNEGWGQFDSDRIFEMLKKKDPTRLYDSTSGWYTQKKSDFDSHHQYFTNAGFAMTIRPLIVSECGGFSFMVPDHYYSKYNNFSYGTSASTEELSSNIRRMYDSMIFPIVAKGGCGCIYTQLSDVEDETNGLYTYDRKVLKPAPDKIREIGRIIEEKMRCVRK